MLIDRQMLLGVGVGLLLAATLSALGGGARRPLSRVELIRQAKALGMSFPDEVRLNLGAVPGAQGGPPASGTGPVAPKAPSEANTPSAVGVVRTVEIVVPPGATGSEVARLLRAKGLIADEKEFLSLATVRQVAPRFMPGAYRVSQDVTVKALIEALSKGPKAE